MKRQLSNTICGLKFAIEKNDFEQLKSSSGKKRNNFVANSVCQHYAMIKSTFCNDQVEVHGFSF